MMDTLEYVLLSLRVARGLSRRQLALIADVDESTISSYEQGRRRPSISVVLRLAEALEATAGDRIKLLALVGYPFGRDARHEVEAALTEIATNRHLTVKALSREMGLSPTAVEEQLAQDLPPAELLSASLDRLDLGSAEAHRLRRAYALRAAALAPTRPASDGQWEASEAVEVMMLALQGTRHGADMKALRAKAADTLVTFRDVLLLSEDDIAKMISATPQEIAGWINDSASIPPFVVAQLQEFEHGLQVLQTLFTRERIPDVLRRPARLFGGQSAIDLIMQGAIELVASKYDRVLKYTA